MMKKVKIVTFLILTFGGFLYMGELSILYLDSFTQEYYDSDFYIDSAGNNVSDEEMIQDMCEAAEKYDVDFFATDLFWEKSYLYETRIIGTEQALEHLKEKGIKEGINKSIFFDDQKIIFEGIEKCKDVSNISKFYFIGNESDLDKIQKFKADLIDKYGGGYPHNKVPETEFFLYAFVVWGIIYLIVSGLSFYEVSYMKKENMIRVVMGERIERIFMKSVLEDTISFSLIFFILPIALRSVSNVLFKFRWVMSFFLVFLVLNVLINALILRNNYKRIFANASGDNGILSLSYIFKTVLSIVAVLVLAVNVSIIQNGLNIYKQKDFFTAHDKYYYYEIGYPIGEPYDTPDEFGENMEDKLYKDFYKKFHDKAYLYGDSNDDEINRLAVLNANSFIETCESNEKLRQLKGNVLEHNISVLFPAAVKDDSELYGRVLEMKEIFCKESECGKWNIQFYDNGVTVEAVHKNAVDSNYEKYKYNNPIIIVNNADTFYKSGSSAYDPFYDCDVMYGGIDERAFRQFITEHKVDSRHISVTNVKDEYDRDWNCHKRKLILSTVLSAFIVFLEVGLIFLIIQMEYQFNAIELAIRKALGYSLLERNVRLVKGSILAGVGGIMAALLLNMFAELGGDAFAIIGVGVLLICIEVAAVFIKASIVERKKIALILKGGRI